jgi:hypothetical protein
MQILKAKYSVLPSYCRITICQSVSKTQLDNGDAALCLHTSEARDKAILLIYLLVIYHLNIEIKYSIQSHNISND